MLSYLLRPAQASDRMEVLMRKLYLALKLYLSLLTLNAWVYAFGRIAEDCTCLSCICLAENPSKSLLTDPSHGKQAISFAVQSLTAR